MIVSSQIVDCGEYVRKMQRSENWKKSHSLIAGAKKALTDTGNPNAGIGYLTSRIKDGTKWFEMSDWGMVAAACAAGSDDPIYDDVRQSGEFNEFVGSNPAGVCFLSRAEIFRMLLTDSFKKSFSVKSIGCGAGKPELRALHDANNIAASLTCIDRSPLALDSLMRCAKNLAVQRQITVAQEDVLAPEWEMLGQFDIVSSIGFAGNYLPSKLLSPMLSKFQSGVSPTGQIIVDICFPDTELIEYIGYVLRWPVASITGGKGLQTYTQKHFRGLVVDLNLNLKVAFYEYVYGAICVISRE